MQFLSAPYIIAILIALSVHEWAHGFVAWRLGDPTAKYEGRLTLNPIAHLDPLGTIMFVIIGFGWGKPVPVNPRYFRNMKRDMSLTSLAGPFSNLCLAIVAIVLLRLFFSDVLSPSPGSLLPHGGGASITQFVADILKSSLFVNLGLMAFNLLPIAPLDGSKILLPFIPVRYEVPYYQFMQYGPYILLVLILAENAFGFSLISLWTLSIIHAVLQALLIVL